MPGPEYTTVQHVMDATTAVAELHAASDARHDQAAAEAASALLDGMDGDAWPDPNLTDE